MNKNSGIIFILSTLFLFSSCNKGNQESKSESVDPETCLHEEIIEDEEVEPTKDKDGYTSGHHCKRCGKVLDGHDLLKWNEITLDKNTSFTVKKTIGEFEYSDLTFKMGNVQKGNYLLNLTYHGVFTNLTPVYKIKKLVIDSNADGKEMFLTVGEDNLPYQDEISIKLSHFEITFNDHNHHFLLTNHKNNTVVLDSIVMTYFTLEEPIDETILLPSVEIKTENNASIDSLDEYVNSEITIKDPDNDKYDITSVSAGIRLRGNSTSSAPKKPYRIKFDKKQSVFGLTKAKNWVLLAEWFDASNMHNFMAQSIIQMLPNQRVTLHPKHVTVTLNSEYQGLYVLIENPDEKEGRANIEQDITLDSDVTTLNYLLDYDGRAAEQGIEDIDYVKVKGNNYYEIKYPEIDEFPDYDESNNTSMMFNAFISHVKSDLENAWNVIEIRNVNNIKNLFDMDSLYNQAIIDLFADERDHSWLSFKLYKLDNKIYFGPCWDYDITAFGHIWQDNAMYISDPYKYSASPMYVTSNYWLKVVTNDIADTKYEFKVRLVTFFNEHLESIKKLFREELSRIVNEMIKDARMWKENNISILYENIRYLNNFINTRYDNILSRI